MNRFPVVACIVVASLGAKGIEAQTLSGRFGDPSSQGQILQLAQARGTEMFPVDSITVAPDGSFRFPRTFNATGFYQLALNDSDQVKLILDRREPAVELRFDSLPMRRHVRVEASNENRLLQDFDHVATETAAVLAAVSMQRSALSYTDTFQLERLKEVEERALKTQVDFLEQVQEREPDSYFAKVLRADKAVRNAERKSPMDVATAFDFSDPDLMRSAVYDRAVMAFLQNLRAVHESQFVNAADTLMLLAGRDPLCKAFMLEHLVDLFSTYGPEVALQHVIDRYVAAGDGAVALSPTLKEKVAHLLRISLGRTAPDVVLNDHGRSLLLSELVQADRYTVLFFYSSTCEHCHAQMPQLKEDRMRYVDRGLDVIGIALDTDSADFQRSIRENAIPWRCFSEFNGWGSTVAKAFLVKATPSFFLLDRQMKIVAKPVDAVDLANILGRLYQ
ncbi:MAG: TlpA family protein disulfide reductase [Flavobacteriales bacterium]|nr:TlpA family protein disulfide reductase [Flavobacteriales bacterium]